MDGSTYMRGLKNRLCIDGHLTVDGLTSFTDHGSGRVVSDRWWHPPHARVSKEASENCGGGDGVAATGTCWATPGDGGAAEGVRS